MDLKLKLRLREAIKKALDDSAEDYLWDEYLHPELCDQMANAAEIVFDAGQLSAAYSLRELE